MHKSLKNIRFSIKPRKAEGDRPVELARTLGIHPLTYQELPYDAAVMINKSTNAKSVYKIDASIFVDKILEVAPLLEKGLYKEGLQTLASLKISVDTFFDEVLVVCEDASLRENRLALLQQLRDLFLQTADISHLHKS